MFETDTPLTRQRRHPSAAPLAAWASPLGTLGLGLVVGALVAGALFWFWSHSAPRPAAAAPALPPAPAVAEPAPMAAPVAPTTPTDAPAPASAAARPEPLPGPPEASALLKSDTEAWRELGPLWGQPLASGEPCAAAQQAQLQCYRTDRMTLAGLRQLDRPGIITLRQASGSGQVLVTALTGDSATLQAGEQRWRMPIGTLTNLWRGDFATLWRTPPGQTTRLVDGRTGPAADWLGKRIADLQAAGKVPASADPLVARIQAFQRANGIEAAGLAGPITFMQVNLASGVDEPRLSRPGS